MTLPTQIPFLTPAGQPKSTPSGPSDPAARIAALRADAGLTASILPASAIQRATRHERRRSEQRWSWDALRGQLIELSTHGPSAALAFTGQLMHQAQLQHEPCAWVSAVDSVFFPPDMASAGVDLIALPVIRTSGAHDAMRCADRLLRSGAFGMLVIDLGDDDRVPGPLLGRMQRVAQKVDALVCCLTNKPASASSMGSMVTLRAEARRWEMVDREHYRCTVRGLKDKRQAPGWTQEACFLAPIGVR